ncbi:hypothetical protein [Tunturiibacter gelidoferens]|uniref:Uncharacterized protein n=1 Tax=Tunturiibacter gelidiferens TaxID=3069689 RepID=A0ACC5P3M7_9BACT|nr:hypothetical protein [Edaphobacter lichenicola]MBB5341464.1 hypothetical protein [Edaphobacter lichenicola]
MTEVSSGQTVTISGSVGGIPAALIKQGIVGNCNGINLLGSVCMSNKTVNNLSRLSYTVAFNTGSNSQSISGSTSSTSTSSAQPATFTAATNTISSATAKYVIRRGAAASISDTVKAIDNLARRRSLQKHWSRSKLISTY